MTTYQGAMWGFVAAGLAAGTMLVSVTMLRSLAATLHTHGHAIHLEVARSPAARQKGLSGRAKLPRNKGMLFVFDRPATQCFWMRDMHFDIDIVWLDAQKRVRHIEPDVSPKTYPKTFCPAVPAKYVLELAAGQARAAKIGSGQRLDF